MTIPENEPTSIRAGDTAEWSKISDDYPASGGWVLSYAFRSPDGYFNITAATHPDNGDWFLVSKAASQTTGYTAGEYDWVAAVTKATDRHTIDSGRMTVLPNLATTTAYDARSDARAIYNDLIAAYKTYVSTGGHIDTYSIGGRSVRYRSMQDLLDQVKFWANEVRREDEAEAIANGKANPRRVGIRFNRL